MSASRRGRYTPWEKRPRCPLNRRLVGPGLGVLEEIMMMMIMIIIIIIIICFS
jgi:hypothetical protein